jgi:methionyl-tRNA formyltransferase
MKHAANLGLSPIVIPNETDEGLDGSQPSLRKAAEVAGIQIEGFVGGVLAGRGVFISLEFDKIVVPETSEGIKFYNIHFSLLPKYRGCFTSFWPIFNGDSETGVTLHEIDSGIDTGKIIDQHTIPLSADVTARELYEIYQDEGLKLFVNNLENIISGNFVSHEQSSSNATYFSRKSFSSDQNEIPFNTTAWQVKNFVRSYYFPEYQTATFEGALISRCEVLSSRSSLKPGTIAKRIEGDFIVATTDFDVRLVRA